MDETPRSPDDETGGAPAEGPRAIEPRLLELLVCPLTKTSLVYVPEHHELVSRAARLAFPIRDGIPLMSVEAARQLADDEAVP
jgi:uncharacterized protein YbaR (Trm112 family)